MTDVAAAMGVSDIELNDVPDMRQDPKEAIDAPLVAPGPCYATHLDVSAAQTRARDTVDAVARVAHTKRAAHMLAAHLAALPRVACSASVMWCRESHSSLPCRPSGPHGAPLALLSGGAGRPHPHTHTTRQVANGNADRRDYNPKSPRAY